MKTAESGEDKAKTKMWADIVKGLKMEDELETTNSDECGIELEVFDSDTPNQRKAMQREGKQRTRQHCDDKGAKKGQRSRQANWKSRGMLNRTGRGA